MYATCIGEAGHGRQVGRLSQDQTDSLGMGFALVVRLGHDGGGEEHVTQGAALVPVHLRLCTVLEERRGETHEGDRKRKQRQLKTGKTDSLQRAISLFLSLSHS